MELPRPKQTARYALTPVIILACFALQSCSHKSKVYQSNCDIDRHFKHVSFKQLTDSLAAYDQQYIEVTGKYMEDKELSALFCDSLFDRNEKNALWVNFSQDCPLYLSGTHQGLFEVNDGHFTQINNKSVTIRGKIDLRNKGSNHHYKATIDRVSLVKI